MQCMKRTATVLMVAVSAALSMSACKEDTIIRSDAVPDVDNINTFQLPDTATLITRTVFDDSIITGYKNIATYYHALGSLNTDPFFGKTHGAIYFQVIPPSTSFTFQGTNPQIDSVVMVLPYSGFTWGDTTNASPVQKVRVFPIAEQMQYDTSYYSKQRVSVDRSKLLGTQNMYPRGLRDSVNIWGTNYNGHLRIPMDTAQLMPLLRKGIDSSADNPKFLANFYGFYVEPDTTIIASSLPYFLLSNGAGIYDRAGIVIYYHNNSADSLTTAFALSTTLCAHYNFIKRDYSGTPAFTLMSPAAPANPNVLLIQNEPGAAIDVRIPLQNLLPDGTAVNKAQLIFTEIDTALASTYFSPGRIFPVGVKDDATTYSIADRYPLDSNDPINFIDGTRKSVTIGSVVFNQYTINFPRELQQAVKGGKNELHLRINGTQTFPAAYRLIARGRPAGDRKLKLNIIYSKP